MRVNGDHDVGGGGNQIQLILCTSNIDAVHRTGSVASRTSLPDHCVPRANMSGNTRAAVISAIKILAPVHPNRNHSRQVRAGIEGIATAGSRSGKPTATCLKSSALS
jgi:hypothetical protein